MTDNQGANREYKDRLFKFIFGNPEKKEWTLSLYNAISGQREGVGSQYAPFSRFPWSTRTRRGTLARRSLAPQA